VQTSLARGLQGQANLHITGTPQRPVVLGGLSVNAGMIEFFGNHYTIDRGEVHFYNALKIDPVIDLDLETRVRGVTVDIMLSGPLNKLNLSYRSDPPLKSEQIVALLTVGRTPNAPGELASTQATGQTGFLASGSNVLLQQAITAPVTGRLEKFFGVSHIKLDPQLTDITTVPQARLSLEQQISKDVTLTYTTNLARTQEQLIQLEWDLNRNWSVVAVRDENGFFGVDFQYRKRFK
jgi:translocation and assembly module TamB